MAQKAKLDILDIPLGNPTRPEGSPGPFSGDRKPEGAERSWYKNWRVLAGGLGGLAVLTAAVAWFLWSPFDQRTPPGKAALIAAGVPASAAATATAVEDFYVDVPDASGKPRLAVVSLVLDPVDPGVLPQMNGTEVRKTVHAILSGKTAEALRAPREREGLRKEIAGGINQVLKREAVRTVWFSDLNVW
jgi:flagellar basal body-associated protein FliL